MPASFDLQAAKNGQYYFTLKAPNGQVILKSEMYNSKSSAKNGIASVQKNAGQDARFERRVSKKKEPFFVLKAGNHQVIGASEMYSSDKAMENGIASVKTNGPKATVNDLTT